MRLTWRIFSFVTHWLMILSLPLLLLSASIGIAVNSHWLYEYGFNKYHVSQTTGLAPAELDKAARALIDYFNSNETFINLTVMKDGKPFDLFNERETLHLRDVKALIRLDYKVLLETLLFAFAYAAAILFWRRDWRQLAQEVVGGSGLTLALILLLGLGIMLNFDQFFLQFHLISFSNEFWQLDPTRDYLIMLFPRGFWFDAAAFCTLTTLAMALISGVVAGGFILVRKAPSSQAVR